MNEKQELIANDRSESMKKILDLALALGRAKQSSHTGFIHHTYHSQEENERDTIPIVENFLYALALLRARTSESMNEGKALIEKLLFFQNRTGDTANFPVYIHEYPECRDRYLSANLLPIFFWIIKNFHQILGADLKHKLEITVNALLVHNLLAYEDKIPSFPVAIKIAASAKAFGEMAKRSDLINLGDQLLEELRQTSEYETFPPFCCPTTLADTILSLQMIYPKISESPWKNFWQWVSNTWHPKVGCYIGPALKAIQAKSEPEATAYDLCLSYFSGSFSSRVLKSNTYQLFGALLQPSEDVLFSHEALSEAFVEPKRCSLNGKIGLDAWQMLIHNNYSYSLLERHELANPALDKGCYPFMLTWGEEKRVHTFGCSSGNGSKVSYRNTDKVIELQFDLETPALPEEREKNRDIVFYIDNHEDLSFYINDQLSSTFNLNDQIRIVSKERQISLKFSLVEGFQGDFFGHLMLGNRPSQICLKGENRFKAFDWQIFLRAIKRPVSCGIKVEIKIE